MPLFANPRRASPPTGELFVGVGIKRIGSQPPPQYHVAIIYGSANFGCRLSHLETENRFIDSDWDASFLWHEADALDEVDMSATAAFLMNLAKSRPLIPYGFRSLGCRFELNLRTGAMELRTKDPNQGLTCSTFISVVFRSLSLPLLVEESWPSDRVEDADWRAGMLVNFLRVTISPERFKAVATGIPDARARPSEVAAAFTRDTWPARFDDVRDIAIQIAAEVESARLHIV